jgi:2-polyprenyl-3-methyl-5-hydroxy-6-metoxy-1,4-benzoquinol methylase
MFRRLDLGEEFSFSLSFAMSQSPPRPRARTEIHRKVMELVERLGSPAGKAALDVPLGPGAMAWELSRLGYRVTGLDIDLAQSEGLSSELDRREANLNHPLPLADESFDLVTCLEGIEHVENHLLLIQEISRVLRPGGALILSTPNIGNLEERLNYLMRGTFYRNIPADEFRVKGTGFDHQNLIGFVEIRQFLAWSGLEFDSVHTDRVKPKQWIFLWPLALLIKGYAAIQSEKRKTKYLMDETASNPVLMGGNTVIVLARKPAR